jgi:deazaflavin-dependent oxidoreductase (nitroreductase family)
MSTETNDWNARVIEDFRANGGRVGGQFEGFPLLLLHTTGAKSGKERVNPLAYGTDGDHLVVFGSKGGAPMHPDWYHNIVANPRARVEVGTDTFDVTAHVAEGDERARIWDAWKQQVPAFAEYERSTSREIPVIVLERAA